MAQVRFSHSLFAVFATAFVAAPVVAQTIVWNSAVSGAWQTAANWGPGTVPNNVTTHRASISAGGPAYTVTANGGAIALQGLDLSSSAARVVFDFASSSSALTLGNGTSTWSAGNVELRNASGLNGSGLTGTTVAVASGVELLFSTSTGTRSLSSLTLNNSGTLRVNSGRVSISSAAINNQSGGLVHADGAEIAFLGTGNLANAGTLRATGANGLLRFGNTVTTANLGSVQLVSGGRALLEGTLNNSAATLAAPSGGTFELTGGTISGGTIASGALTFTGSGGVLSGATLSGDLVLPANTHVYLAGGGTFSGANANLGTSAYIYWQQAGTLTGKSLAFANGAYVYVSGVNNALTLDAGSSASGRVQLYSDGNNGTAITNQGTITHNSGTGYLYARTLTNSGTITSTAGDLNVGSTSTGYNTFNTGTITANGAGAIVSVRGNVTNTGTLSAQNSGELRFEGTNTTANLGNVQLASGGSARLGGTLNNASATLTAPTGGAYELRGGTISGGTIAAGALTFTNSAGTLSGVTLADNLVVPDSAGVYLSNGTTFNGASATFGSSAYTYWQQAGTLTGKTLTFGDGSYLYVSGTNNTLTLDSTSTANGRVQIYSDGSNGTAITNLGTIAHANGNGYLYSRTFTNNGTITATGGDLQIGSTVSTYNSINAGTITATGANTTVRLNGNVSNTGTLSAQNSGQLIFSGTNNTGNLGNVQLASGGSAQLAGTLNNASATLTAPTGGAYQLRGGTISGGTIAAGALTFTNSWGTLSGTTLTGDFVLPSSAGVYFLNGTTFTGANATFGSSAQTYWQQAGTLTGKALTFGDGSLIYVNGVNNTLTLDGTSTASGRVQIYSDSNNGTAITNQGTITHNLSTGYLYARSFTNSGSITSTAGNLQVGSNSTNFDTLNTGTISANGAGASVSLNGNVTNAGTLSAQNSGQLIFDGTNTTANLGNVQLATGGRARITGTLNNTAATLTAPTGGTFELTGGTISGGSIAPGALTLTNSAGTFSGATLTGDLTLPASAGLFLTNGGGFSGANATLGGNSYLYWQQVGTLSGKSITFNGGSYIYVSGVNRTLTLDATSSATGEVRIYSDGNNGTAITNQGAITHTVSNGYLYARNFTNSGTIVSTAGNLQIGTSSTGYDTFNTGTITANGASAIVSLDGNVVNTGTLAAQNSGQLVFGGTNTTANLGSVQLSSGGRARLVGVLNNTGATLNAPAGGVYELGGGTITGGTIAAGALALTNSGGTVDGVTLAGDFGTAPGAGVSITGGSTFTGPNAVLGANSYIYWRQTGTLSGKALTFGPNSYLYINGANRALTLDAASSATGEVTIYSDGSNGTAFTNQGAITHTGGNGYLYARSLVNSGTVTATGGTLQFGTTSTSYSASNSGTITANGSSAVVDIEGGVVNTGTLSAQNSGRLVFRGSTTTANLGNVALASGGRALLDGTLDNAAATLTAPAGGMFELFGGTVLNGLIAPNALTFTSSGGTLNGVGLAGDFVLPANAGVTVTGGTSFAGSNFNLGAGTYLYWQQAGTLAGKSVSFAPGSYLYLSGANRTLTLDGSTTVNGQVQIYSDGSTGSVITNQGAITHTNGSGYVYARTLSNSGSITSTGGTLRLGSTGAGYSTHNAGGGTLRLAGGNIDLDTSTALPILNDGLIDVQSGTLFTGGRLTNAAGTITGGGTINGGLILAGGTLAPGNAVGTLTFSGGAFTVTQPATLLVEINGLSADRLTFQSQTAPVDLGAGLLTLSVTLLSPPGLGVSYTLMNYNFGGSGFVGNFAGLPVSGSTFSANYLGTPYLFSVNYQANAIVLQSVPEPGTYVLIALGIPALWLMRRRAARSRP